MKQNQKILQLHPHQSKLIDSLCFQLAVNIPDDNSLSLLDVLSMRKSNEITSQQCKQLYKQWLQSKNIYDIFTAKQLKIYPKQQLLKQQLKNHLQISTINTYLQMLHDIYHQLLKDKKKNISKQNIQYIQDLFSYLDKNGNIHLRLSQMFILCLGLSIHQNSNIDNYQSFKNYFKQKNNKFCMINGIVSLRWFTNYFIIKQHQESIKPLISTIKNIQNILKHKDKNGLPNILQQAFVRWKNNSKSYKLFESKRKRFQIYYRIFDQNQQIFFFNGGKDQHSLNITYFTKKYGQQLIKTIQLDNNLLKEFSDIVKQLLNQYIVIISKNIYNTHKYHNRSNLTAPYYLGASKSNVSSFPHNSMLNMSTNINSHKKSMNKSYQASMKYSNNKSQKNSVRQKTPVKNNSNLKGNQTKRFKNITPVKKQQLSPLAKKEFGSTQKYISSGRSHLTPTKSNNGYGPYLGNTQQIYKNSKKQGLQKDSFYQKLFFFRNKRVESFDIVIKRLKGK